jgi:hypothetical protein
VNIFPALNSAPAGGPGRREPLPADSTHALSGGKRCNRRFPQYPHCSIAAPTKAPAPPRCTPWFRASFASRPEQRRTCRKGDTMTGMRLASSLPAANHEPVRPIPAQQAGIPPLPRTSTAGTELSLPPTVAGATLGRGSRSVGSATVTSLLHYEAGTTSALPCHTGGISVAAPAHGGARQAPHNGSGR